MTEITTSAKGLFVGDHIRLSGKRYVITSIKQSETNASYTVRRYNLRDWWYNMKAKIKLWILRW